MTIKDSLYFTFDGVNSNDMGLLNVNIDGGMLEEYFSYNRDIIETKTRGRSKPYFNGVEKEPLLIPVSFAFEDYFNEQKLNEVKRWLCEQDTYKPLIFSNNNEKIYYALVVEDPHLIHNGLQQGYLNITFRCNDSYAYSPLTFSKEYDWDEEDQEIIVDQFTNGTMKSLELNSEDKLILTPTKRTWNDFNSTDTWLDIKD